MVIHTVRPRYKFVRPHLIPLLTVGMFLFATSNVSAQSITFAGPQSIPSSATPASAGPERSQLITTLLLRTRVQTPSNVQFPAACMHECTADCSSETAQQKHECFRICADLCREAMFTDELARELARLLRSQK